MTRFSRPSRPSNRTAWLAALGLAALTLAAYAPATGNDFINFDDVAYVVRNPHVLSRFSWSGVRWALAPTREVGNWHPLTWLSLQLDYQVQGNANPFAFHLTNVLIHAAATVALFGALWRLTGALWRSALVAALFGIHPERVESVAWVSERKDVLCALFWFLAIWAYAGYAQRPRAVRYAAVVSAFALGLMAKSMIVTLPCLLLILDYWPLGRCLRAPRAAKSDSARQRAGIARSSTRARLIREKVPLILLSAIASALTIVAQRRGEAVISENQLPLVVRFGNAGISYVRYIGKTCWPQGLLPFYPYPSPEGFLWKSVASLMAIAIVTFVAFRLRKHFPYLLVGWLWYLGTLVPVIGLVQVGMQGLADRYTSVPAVGLFIMAAWGLGDLVQHAARVRLPVIVATATVIALGAFATVRQIAYWHDSITLWRHALDVEPENYQAHYLLGLALADEGHGEECAAELSRSLESKEDQAETHYALARALVQLNDVDGAIRHYRRATDLKPTYAEAWNNLGNLLLRIEDWRGAVACYETAEAQMALAESPHLAMARQNLMQVGQRLHDQGLKAFAAGRVDEAIQEFQLALRCDARSLEVQVDLAVVLMHKGERVAAISHFQQALRQDPRWPGEANRTAWLLATDSDPSRRNGSLALRWAIAVCEATDYTNPDFIDTLAAAYAEAGQFERAANAAQKAVDGAQATSRSQVPAFRDRLLSYQQQKPWRDPPGRPGK